MLCSGKHTGKLHFKEHVIGVYQRRINLIFVKMSPFRYTFSNRTEYTYFNIITVKITLNKVNNKKNITDDNNLINKFKPGPSEAIMVGHEFPTVLSVICAGR